MRVETCHDLPANHDHYSSGPAAASARILAVSGPATATASAAVVSAIAARPGNWDAATSTTTAPAATKPRACRSREPGAARRADSPA